MNTPFYFFTQVHLIKLLGIKAKNPVELLKGLKKVPHSSIYYHTHKFLQQHYYLSPEPPNDFAYWVTSILGLKELGESLVSINTIDFITIEELRQEFITRLEDYISKGKHLVDCSNGFEFHFMSCKTFVLPTSFIANNLEEFKEALSKISIGSLYFHIFEARWRLKGKENDFSAWLKGIGRTEIAEELYKLDPYTITLEGLREKIIKIIDEYD